MGMLNDALKNYKIVLNAEKNGEKFMINYQ